MKRILAAAAAFAMLATPLCLDSAHAASRFTGLSFQSEYGETHPAFINVFRPFFNAAKARFPERLGFEYFTNNELFRPSDAFTAAAKGKVDFGNMRPSVFNGRCELLGVVDLPGMCGSAIVGSLVAYDLIRKFPEVRAELPEGTVNFTAWASTPYQLNSIKPIPSLDGLKGLRVIVWDAPSEACMKKLGANPIRLVSTDSYLALSKGLADAVLCPISPVRSLKLSDICRYHTMLNLFTSTFLQQVNSTIWESLPEDMHDWLLKQGGGKMALEVGIALDKGAADDTAVLRTAGHVFHELTPVEYDTLTLELDPFVEEWRHNVAKAYSSALANEVLAYCRERSRLHQQEARSGRYGGYGQ